MLKQKNFSRWRRYYLLTGVFLVFLSAFILWNFSASNPLIERFINYFHLANISVVIDYTVLPINKYFNQLFNPPITFNNLAELSQELRKAKQDLFFKERELNRLLRVEAENNYFRNILGYFSNSSFGITAARVISYEPQNQFTFFWIDAGLNKGIKENMPVVGFSHDGKESLIGYIEKSIPNSSQVRTILDPQTHVGILIDKYQSRGILRGDKELNQLLSVDYIDSSLTNLNNLSIITSGMGERYPPGIYIGKIIDENQSVYGLFKKVAIKPAIDFFSIKDVFVIKRINTNN